MNRSKILVLATAGVLTGCVTAALAQTPKLTPEQVNKGAVLLPYKDYSTVDPLPLVHEYEGLRVSDVLDALQAIGIQDITLMDKTIRPLWRDNSERASHRIYGVAVTYQYLPTNRPMTGPMSYEEFKKWHSHWYQTYAPEVFVAALRPGTIVVIDSHEAAMVGFCGSNNSLNWKNKGAAGVVTNGNCRDTDELILEKVPIYSRYQGGGTRPGRIEAGLVNLPVTVGGVMVRPGDMIVADGDGVVVVPREKAEEVAKIGWDIAKGDKATRQRLYKQGGLPVDSTLK
jgi:4-hydroxy-4-methyl-2-oxoglutarate aldolase